MECKKEEKRRVIRDCAKYMEIDRRLEELKEELKKEYGCELKVRGSKYPGENSIKMEHLIKLYKDVVNKFN